ncbi:hypothetical protein AG1IA_10243 [Rhizoctonia solani AG-1 IA]|uniref:Uncharacterized protein n=1 Tax=Thanatephorus cucumeris (strain AG1-IA) TaxID=983506 RepID=L8WG83_THACA|nr:hypothetical protein AG1IA_10243 [Rhizoctonia solani AG-1 IA]
MSFLIWFSGSTSSRSNCVLMSFVPKSGSFPRTSHSADWNGMQYRASWYATVGTIRVTSRQSADVLVQKKLAARSFSVSSHLAKVHAMVVLPVPAIPLIQYTAFWSGADTQRSSSERMLTRVPSVHVRLLVDVESVELYVAFFSAFRSASLDFCSFS